MAPSSRNDHSENAKLRDEIFCDVAFKSEVPADYISLKKAERDYGVHLQDFKKFGVPLDGLGAVRGKQNGHLGIYFEQDYLENVRSFRIDEKVPEDYLSEKYLESCLERKDGLPKGWVKQYRESDPDASAGQAKGWAVFGQKKGQRGPATFFYPQSFVRHKAIMEVLPKGSMTWLEIHHHPGASLRSGAIPVFGIRPDQQGKPGYFYTPVDIML